MKETNEKVALKCLRRLHNCKAGHFTYVIERTRTSAKCREMNNARIMRAKALHFIVKYANLTFLRPWPSWLLKIPF